MANLRPKVKSSYSDFIWKLEGKPSVRLLPHGFFEGEKVYYVDGQYGQTKVYGIVKSHPDRDNKAKVWAYWAGSEHLSYMPLSLVHRAEVVE